MSDSDLILIREGEAITFYRPIAELEKKLRKGENVDLLGVAFRNLGACCEWLEVVDMQTKKPVGILFVDFYKTVKHQSVAGLKARNIIWTPQGEAVCLFAPSNEWESQGGPYLPVHLLASDAGQVCYFVMEGLPCEKKLDVPTIASAAPRK